MKLKFKTQAFQTAAVQAVIDCFRGQPNPATGIQYQIDLGISANGQTIGRNLYHDTGFRNADIAISDDTLLENIRQVQRQQNLPQSSELAKTRSSPINLDIEMETGTGKTYCYIKTIFEMNKQFGWSKFIIVVPSIAIREGVEQSLKITAEHFLETYGRKPRFFIYNSRQLHHLESFASDAGINVMIINVQAFHATGKDARRIYEELDDFQSRRPIDVISANRPILILDEPQKMEGGKTLDALINFNPLMVLRYSATHKTTHNKIHRLDALDAYNQKLVKKIAVRGIKVRGLAGTNAYIYLQSIEISSSKPPEARVEFERKLKSGEIRRVLRKLKKSDNLFHLSNELNQYRGYVVSDINANTDNLSFTNGLELYVGDACGDVNEATLRRIQIREAIKAHFDKEQTLFQQGIKVLTLFFIDEVARYRNYSAIDEKGDYARIFEEEYVQFLEEVLNSGETIPIPYIEYLKNIEVAKTHNGYFSIDKKSKRLIDPEMGKRATEADDVYAYDLILKDKERLLSFDEPVRFIFSHSALREGWDNPNIFVICTLKHSDNTISRRQEVGRGMRLSVNQNGDRMDNPAIVHNINVLTVVTSESYTDFVSALQKDISESLSDRPRVANAAWFTGKILSTPTGDVEISQQMARQIEKYLIKNDYTDDAEHVTDIYVNAQENNALATLPPELQEYTEQIHQLIASVLRESQLPSIGDDRRSKENKLNSNFKKLEFTELWNSINQKAVYSVNFASNELVDKAVAALNDQDAGLRVTPLQYIIQKGEQASSVSWDDLKNGNSFKIQQTDVESNKNSAHSAVRYDLIGKISEGTLLTRRTTGKILDGLNAEIFAEFRTNPENFIAEAIRLINEQKATMIIEHLTYDKVEDKFDLDIFTAGQTRDYFSRAGDKLKRHIYDYVITDSNVERDFVEELDTCQEVVVYAKLPRGFLIPTPVGDYNPDWAITFKQGKVKHVYFVAETKGSMSSMVLNEIEKTKIKCARKFFDRINSGITMANVRYDIVKNFDKLMELVK